MNAEQLKNSILQRAIEGKLVELAFPLPPLAEQKRMSRKSRNCRSAAEDWGK